MKFFSENISIFTAKISDDPFLVIDQVFRIFHFFSQIFRIFYYVQCRIRPFPHKNNHYFRKKSFMTPFFTLFVLSRASDNTTSLKLLEGTDAWAVPHLKFLRS